MNLAGKLNTLPESDSAALVSTMASKTAQYLWVVMVLSNELKLHEQEDFLMGEPKIERIEEVVIAVEDANEAAAYFKDLFGMEFSEGWELPHERIKVRSERIAGTQLQFIESTHPQGVVAKFINQRGEGLNHIAFRVSNLREMVRRLKAKGVRFIPDEVIEVADRELPVSKGKVGYIFIHPQSARGVLIELIESK